MGGAKKCQKINKGQIIDDSVGILCLGRRSERRREFWSRSCELRILVWVFSQSAIHNPKSAIVLIGRALQVLALNFFDERGPVQVEQTGSLVLHPPRLDQGLKD